MAPTGSWADESEVVAVWPSGPCRTFAARKPGKVAERSGNGQATRTATVESRRHVWLLARFLEGLDRIVDLIWRHPVLSGDGSQSLPASELARIGQFTKFIDQASPGRQLAVDIFCSLTYRNHDSQLPTGHDLV